MTADFAAPNVIARWAQLYGNSKTLSTTITFLHFAGMLVGGGFALVADRDAFRISRDAVPALARELEEMAVVHRWVIGGLIVVVVSGLLMMLADIHTYGTSIVFWIKMGLFVLLVANGFGRIRSEVAILEGVAGGWAWLRRTSVASAVLWLAVVWISTVLTFSS
jgi:uncharacterized membrane protein